VAERPHRGQAKAGTAQPEDAVIEYLNRRKIAEVRAKARVSNEMKKNGRVKTKSGDVRNHLPKAGANAK
jgi:hypothetical protein